MVYCTKRGEREKDATGAVAGGTRETLGRLADGEKKFKLSSNWLDYPGEKARWSPSLITVQGASVRKCHNWGVF